MNVVHVRDTTTAIKKAGAALFLEMFHESKDARDRRPNVADLLLAQPDVLAGPCIWKHSQKQTQEAPVLAGTIH